MTEQKQPWGILVFVASLILIILLLGFMYTLSEQQNRQLKSFLAEKYNFSEEECVGGDVIYAEQAKLTCSKDFPDCSEYNNTKIWDKKRGCLLPLMNVSLYERTLPCADCVYADNTHFAINVGYISNVAKIYNCSVKFIRPVYANCSLYCHTKQVQDGEMCKTEQKNDIIEISNSIIVVVNQLYYREQYPAEIGMKNATTEMWEKYHVPIKWAEYRSDFKYITYNQTICTPKFRNETYGCQSGDDMRRNRKVIR